jgi:VIT1/CCC1 family predicted Fe2+/Mn2+ transporter
VLGANDGIVSTASLIVGVAAAARIHCVDEGNERQAREAFGRSKLAAPWLQLELAIRLV